MMTAAATIYGYMSKQLKPEKRLKRCQSKHLNRAANQKHTILLIRNDGGLARSLNM